ncbi:hypothetical protein Hanom_Chr15g01404561 [Helianthus anomalus]
MTSFLKKVISWCYILHIYPDGISWLVNFNLYLFPKLQGLHHLLHLYTDSCGTTKLYEAKIKQLETTIADQGTIVEAKTRHYEDKLKKLGGNPVPHPAKAGTRETSKAAEVVDKAGEKKDARKDAGEDAGKDAAQVAEAEKAEKDGDDAAV